jgi:hypothetical protein
MLLCFMLFLAADVLDVGPAPAPFPDIRSAVESAADGDLIRVAEGSYPFFGVIGKSLKITALEDGADVQIVGTVRIQNLAAGQSVVLDGLEIRTEEFVQEAALVVANTEGAVRIQDCTVRGVFAGFDSVTSQAVGLRTANVSDMTVTNSSIIGGREYKSGHDVGQEGVVMHHTTATFFNSTITGSNCTFGAFGFNGGDGIRAYDSEVFLHGCTVEGGQGADGFNPGGSNGCGGDCVKLFGSSLRYLDVEFDPGVAGWNLGGRGCSTFASASQVVPDATSVSTSFEGPAIAFDSGHGWVSAGDSLELAVEGPLGYTALMILGPETERLVPTTPGYVGDVFVLGPLGTPRRVVLGSSPASLSITVPDLGALTTTEWYLQPVLVGEGRVIFGPMRSVTLLGSGF